MSRLYDTVKLLLVAQCTLMLQLVFKKTNQKFDGKIL